MDSRRESSPVMPISQPAAGGRLLLSLVVLFILCGCGRTSIPWLTPRTQSIRKEYRVALPVTARTLVLNVTECDVDIRSTGGREVAGSLSTQVPEGPIGDPVRSQLDALILPWRPQGDRMVLAFGGRELGSSARNTRLTVFAPSDLSLEVRGDRIPRLQCSGRAAPTAIRVQGGSLNVADQFGDLDVSLASGDLSVSTVEAPRGTVKLDVAAGSIDLFVVSAAQLRATLTTGNMLVGLESPPGTAMLEVTHGDLDLSVPSIRSGMLLDLKSDERQIDPYGLDLPDLPTPTGRRPFIAAWRRQLGAGTSQVTAHAGGRITVVSNQSP